MGSLFLIRHGQASYGQADYDRLSERGIAQAQALGRHLSRTTLDGIFVGPHLRQKQTYEQAASVATALPGAIEHAGLAEYPAFHLLQYFIPKLAEADAKFAQLSTAPTPKLMDEAFHTILRRWGDDSWTAPDLERVGAFVDRVRGALETAIASAGRSARIGVITSAGPIGVAIGLVMGLSPDRMIRTSVVVRNASITELKYRSGSFAWHQDQVSVISFNVTGHLPDELVSDR